MKKYLLFSLVCVQSVGAIYLNDQIAESSLMGAMRMEKLKQFAAQCKNVVASHQPHDTTTENRTYELPIPDKDCTTMTNAQIRELALQEWDKKGANQNYESPEHEQAAKEGYINGVVLGFRILYLDPEKPQEQPSSLH